MSGFESRCPHCVRRRVRPAVKTPGLQPGNTGSTPVCDAASYPSLLISSAGVNSRFPPFTLIRDAELGWRVEAFHGQPRDIEWAYAEGRFWL